MAGGTESTDGAISAGLQQVGGGVLTDDVHRHRQPPASLQLLPAFAGCCAACDRCTVASALLAKLRAGIIPPFCLDAADAMRLAASRVIGEDLPLLITNS